MARWARLELATDGLENRCSIRLSYHRMNAIARVLRVILPDKGKPTLDSPSPKPTFRVLSQILGVVAQLVRASACHAEGRGFESRPSRHLTHEILVS